MYSDFRLLFEATVGKQGEGDLAVDDLSMTPGCRYNVTYIQHSASVHKKYISVRSLLLGGWKGVE